MALFEPHRSRESEEIVGSDAATRALSVTVVENDLVARVYENIAWFYDLTFGPALHPGRVDAIERMAHQAGRSRARGRRRHRASTRRCIPTRLLGDRHRSVELDAGKARERVARKGVRNVRLLQMDAANLKFADDTFDIVYAPYVISVVPDPVAVTREMVRVCRPGGRIVILNHFRSKSRVGAWLERMIAPITLYIGFKSDLDLPAFLVQAGLKPVSIEKVNVPRIWSLVTCVRLKANLPQ